MGKFKLVVAVAVAVPALMLAWQVGLAKWENAQLQEDLDDVAGMTSSRIGVIPAQADEDLRNAVIRKAGHDGITLVPQQVTLRRSGTEKAPVIFLAVDYEVIVTVPGYSFPLHFSPSSEKKSNWY